ncbi:hypothetical protein WKR98_12080 [Pigmentiphaga sp. YJ18]|uniref:hypothetical protein n=1 Tax=Pigmentiphaga sp. YJ18 TaxID=3134907 RepID=UPI003110D2C8
MEHAWQFFRAGGVDQVSIRSGADVCHLDQLDQKLWVALACPTRGIEFDPRTLDLIDTDADGRIRPPELLAACRWTCERLRDPDRLLEGGDTLALQALSDGDPGAQLAEEARHILQLLRKPGDVIGLADVADRSRLLAAMRFNGDGIITEETAETPAARAAIRHIMETHGSVEGLDARPGIDRARVEAFFAEAAAIRQWRDKVAGDPSVVPLGDDTLAAVQAVNAVQAKIDDYYARCRLAAYDRRAALALNPSQEEYRKLYDEALTLGSDRIAQLPLATIAADRPLPLREGVNPAWAQALDTFRVRAAEPLLGTTLDTLAEPAWVQLTTRLEPARNWLAAKPATRLDALAMADLMAMLDEGTEAAIKSLLDADEKIEPRTTRMGDLEKLLRFQRDLVHLLDNFVSFKDFYRREGAVFQAGTLYLDARSCELTVRVDDAARHAALAGLAKAYLVYCDCRRPGEKITIVAAITAGDVDFLFVGRNGVFYDRQGRDWDATIVKIIENPTSIAQAFFSPYKKFVRMIEEQVAKRAAASDAAAQGKLGSLAANLVTADRKDGDARPATPGKVDVGTVAALGVALGSISTVLVAVFTKFVDLGWWIPVALLGIVLSISGPSVLIAWLKLRQRSLGPLLDASGWAINGRMKINVKLGGSLSRMARIPPDAGRNLRDPFAERHGKAWGVAIALAVIALAWLAWRAGLLDAVLAI